jgi:hypothetical protein
MANDKIQNAPDDSSDLTPPTFRRWFVRLAKYGLVVVVLAVAALVSNGFVRLVLIVLAVASAVVTVFSTLVVSWLRWLVR